MTKINSLVEYQKDMLDKTVITGFDKNNLNEATKIFDNIAIPISKNSKIYGYTPQEITSMILANNSEDIDQVWDSLVLDLILANNDMSYCYWSDKNIAYLLEYWTKVDKRISFLFVYSHPKDSIKEIYINSKDIEDDQIDKIMDEWFEYHQLLLKFFYKNLDKTLFFHIDNIGDVSQDYLDDLAVQINLPKIKIKDKEALEPISTTEDLDIEDKDIDVLYDSFANKSTKRYQKVIALYEEIQSIANLPFDTKDDEENLDSLLVATKNIDKTLRKAKKDFLKFEKKSYRKLTKQIKQKELLEIQFFSVQEELEKKILNLNSQVNDENKKQIEQKEENELLMTQLFSVQEELEKEYLSKKDISSKMELRQKDIQELKTQINQKEKNNKDLKSQVDKEKKKYSEQKEENELLLTQLFSVQEELERYYLKSLEPKKKVLKNNGAVNKIKRQLKYKIGKKALSKQNSFFGKILLPISLIIVYLKHKEDKEYLKEFSYYDDYFEARRLKSGLEYTIGQNIKKDASGIFGVFKLPFVVSNTIKEFKNK